MPDIFKEFLTGIRLTTVYQLYPVTTVILIYAACIVLAVFLHLGVKSAVREKLPVAQSPAIRTNVTRAEHTGAATSSGTCGVANSGAVSGGIQQNSNCDELSPQKTPKKAKGEK